MSGFALKLAGSATITPVMSAQHALGAARALARDARAPISPLDAWPAPDGAVVLCPRRPDPERLRELAASLPRLEALVMWWESCDGAQALAALAACGLEHGTIEPLGDAGVLCVLVADEAASQRLEQRLAAPRTAVRALAVMPVHNEADLIHHSIGALVSEGVDVHLLDHESTDETVAIASRWLGCGLERIERFPEESGYGDHNRGQMVWRDILGRVQEVCNSCRHDWCLFVNADEFREAPWPGVSLLDGLREVEELGYNAIDFELLDFRPIDEGFVPGSDPRAYFTHCEPGGGHDALQVKAWRRPAAGVDLVARAGHDVAFEGRRVFPVRFLLRHYPIRSAEHGRRKVLAERLPRFSAAERAEGMHVQYDHLGESFVWDPATLRRFDPDLVRAELLSGALRDLVLALHLSGAQEGLAVFRPERLGGWSVAREPTISLEQARNRLSGVIPPHGASEALDRAAAELARALRVQHMLAGDMQTAALFAGAQSRLCPPAAAPAAQPLSCA